MFVATRLNLLRTREGETVIFVSSTGAKPSH